jgi:thiol:disulfide interchange protein DsbD
MNILNISICHNMKFLIVLLATLFGINAGVNGQKNSPVKWSFELNKVSDQEYQITAIAKMNPSWVIYSQFTDDAGPIPTFFTVNGQQVKFEEKSKAIKEFDEMFDVDVIKFKETAVFTHKFAKSSDPTVKVSVEYMTCDGQRCLPPSEVLQELKY